MDPSLLCEVTLDDDPANSDKFLDHLTEDDIVLVDNEYEENPSNHGSKRPHTENSYATPPPKKARRAAPKVNNKLMQNSKFKSVRNPHSPLSQNNHNSQTSIPPNLLKNKQLSVTSTKTPPKQLPAPRLKQSITWKYKQLPENQYTVDIKKSDILKNYESEKCNCPKVDESSTACGASCINRSTYSECDPEVCVNGVRCTNMVIQKRQYAPGLERFMTAKKGWGVRARQSVAKGTFILEYTGEICSSREFERRMLNRYKGDNHHYCLAMDNKMMIDAHRAGSECRFVNHSCAPNCEMEKWNVGGLSRMALFALRDIMAGEEICYDYNFSLFNTDQGQECKCGAKECRGVIGGRGKDYLITLDNEEPAQQKTQRSQKPVQNFRIVEDEAWFNENLSSEELTWITKNAPKPGQLEAKTIKCTVCNECLNFKVQSQCQRHPDLGVVMCVKCRGLYGKGGWDKDPEGNDEFCRWCSEGGQIFLCDFCPHAFCNKCLRWNLGRKYLKTIDEVEKWKCLKCDPGCLKELRALYWAIYKYHKDRPAKSKSVNTPSVVQNTPKGGTVKTPQQSIKSANPPNSPKMRPQLNGVKSAVKPQILSNKLAPSPKSINNAYSKLQNNGAISVESVKFNRTNGVRPNLSKKVEKEIPKHFVDFMFKDADDCIKQFVNMVGEVKKVWKGSKKKDLDVTTVTKKLRKIFDLAKHNIEEVDKKVVDCYRTNLEDADIRDISPEDIIVEKNKQRELQIFAQSQEISSDLVENVETTPDLPYMEFDAALSDTEPEPNDSGEIVIDESSEDGATGSVETDGDPQVVDVDSEEGIHDMSVEELEVEDEIEEISESIGQENESISVEHDITNSKDSKVTSVVIESSSIGEKELGLKDDGVNEVIEDTYVQEHIESEQLSDHGLQSEQVSEYELESEQVSEHEFESEQVSDHELEIVKLEGGKHLLDEVENLEIQDVSESTFVKDEPEKVKDIKENDKIAIEFINEASPIKDQKDILKASSSKEIARIFVQELLRETIDKLVEAQASELKDVARSKLEEVKREDLLELDEEGKYNCFYVESEDSEVMMEEVKLQESSRTDNDNLTPGDSKEMLIGGAIEERLETLTVGPEDSKINSTCHMTASECVNPTNHSTREGSSSNCT